ncbi:MAG: hypothetical protein ACI835_001432, partial [Planctomycetota bacterium]
GPSLDRRELFALGTSQYRFVHEEATTSSGNRIARAHRMQLD